MKTSKKLFFGFLGLLVLWMLGTDIVLRANYSKGITNSNMGGHKTVPLVTMTLQPFQVIKIASVSGKPINDTLFETRVEQIGTPRNGATNKTEIRSTWATGGINFKPGNQYTLVKSTDDSILISYTADTLVLTLIKSGKLDLQAPALKAIIAPSAHLWINDIKAPSLTVVTGPYVETHFNKTQIGTFSFAGGQQNSLYIEDSKMDSVNITLGKESSLNFNGDYQRGSIQVDSLREIHLSDKVLQKIKSIR
ncbi:hypothetical protein [Chitinophaga qingshengii]|uniref:Auto-transporter adhesin head GIN domain-containing protein n=1 Tax=Chitinophaga qingshengii TaxID=1569794 RepID=A0ABR7TKQ2_9BACT|nr:hypothetical protein [Chitinophaga qingshengii]MBC9931073.1 hypothetical protein [Chitinophaga qingshengii]